MSVLKHHREHLAAVEEACTRAEVHAAPQLLPGRQRER